MQIQTAHFCDNFYLTLLNRVYQLICFQKTEEQNGRDKKENAELKGKIQ